MASESIVNLANDATIKISIYKHYLSTSVKTGQLTAATFGEPFARDLVELAFEHTDLENLNVRRNFPAVDLGSRSASCAYQVTVTGSSDKIIETQATFFDHGLDKTYQKLKFIILGDKLTTYRNQKIVRCRGSFSFDPKNDVYDLDDLLGILVAHGNPEKFKTLIARLDAQLGLLQAPAHLTFQPAPVPTSPAIKLPAHHLHKVFKAHAVTTTNLLEVLRGFGVTRSIYADDEKFSDIASKPLLECVASEFGISHEWLGGDAEHIYSGGPGAEIGTQWRRGLMGAYDLISRTFAEGEKLALFLPAGRSLLQLNEIEDVVDFREPGYEHFFLVAQRRNAFEVNRLRMVISDPLSYGPCRKGILLLFLAVALYRIQKNVHVYIDVWVTPKEQIRDCDMGMKFLVDVKRNGGLHRNDTDFIYLDAQGVLRTTTDVPNSVVPMLQDELKKFSAQQHASIPATIQPDVRP